MRYFVKRGEDDIKTLFCSADRLDTLNFKRIFVRIQRQIHVQKADIICQKQPLLLLALAQ